MHVCVYYSKKAGGEGLPWRSSGLGPRASTAGGAGLIPGLGTKIPHAVGCGHRKKNVKKKIKADGEIELDAKRGKRAVPTGRGN